MEFDRLIISTNAPEKQGLPWFYYLAFCDLLGKENVVICAEEKRNYNSGLVERGKRRLKRELGQVSADKRKQIEQNLGSGTNLVLLFNTSDLELGDLKLLKERSKVELGVYYSDHPLALQPKHRDTLFKSLELFDIVFTFSPSIQPVLYSLGAKRVGVVPFGYCRYTHLPASLNLPDKVSDDLYYFGTWTPEIQKWLEPLVSFELFIEGNQWNKSTNEVLKNIGVKQKVSTNDGMIEMAGRAGVVVNFTRAFHGCFHTMKTFELAIARAAVVTNYSPEQALFFENEKDFIYFNNKEEMSDRINLLLNDKELNLRLRNNAYNKALPFDYHQRGEEILTILKNY